MVYRHKISDRDLLKQVLIDSWAQLSQDTLNWAIDQLSKKLTMVIKAKGGHVGAIPIAPAVSDFPFRLLVDAVTHVVSVFRVCKVP